MSVARNHSKLIRRQKKSEKEQEEKRIRKTKASGDIPPNLRGSMNLPHHKGNSSVVHPAIRKQRCDPGAAKDRSLAASFQEGSGDSRLVGIGPTPLFRLGQSASQPRRSRSLASIPACDGLPTHCYLKHRASRGAGSAIPCFCDVLDIFGSPFQ